jgi:hypothetical protein
MANDSVNKTLESERPLVRAALAFLVFIVFGLGFRVCFPSQYFDDLLFDYNAVSASHAILYLENNLGTPNIGNNNITSHPGLPYYSAMGLVRYIAGLTEGEDVVERTVNFFTNIERFWNIQALAAVLLAGLGAVFFSLYARSAPLGFALALLALPMAYAGKGYCLAYFFDLANETFALPFIGIYMLVARKIFCENSDKSSMIFIFGAAGALFYTVKMPYVIFFAAGFVVPFAIGLKSKSIIRLLSVTAIYIAGFITLLAVVAVLIGPEIVFSWLRYHYNVVTHTGFAGGGEYGVVASKEVLKNCQFLLRYHRAIWPAWLFIGLLIGLLGLKKIKPLSWKPFQLMILVFILNILITLKHWGEHYALVQPILLGFIIYELAAPLFLAGFGGRLGRHCLVSGAILVAFLCAYPGLKILADTLLNTEASRLKRIEFIRKIDELPLNDDEGIYFQWGTHKAIPFSLAALSLDWTYIPTYEGAKNALNKEILTRLFQGRRWLHSGNILAHDSKRPELKIRYFVALGSWWGQELSREHPSLIPWDIPHPRLVYEADDTIVLHSEGKSLAVIEKAAVIDLSDEKL